MRHDFRKNDLVTIKKPLTPEDKERIFRFSRGISGQDMKDYAGRVLRGTGNRTFRVTEFNKTQKSRTEYVTLLTSDDILLPIQARYLTLARRKAKHPLTNIFQD